MHRLAVAVLLGLLLFPSACSKQPEVAIAPPSEPQAEPAAETPADEPTEAASPAEESTAQPESPAEPAKPAEPEIKTVARPSLLLEIIMEPMTYAMQTSVEAVQGLARPITSGGIPGIPALKKTEPTSTDSGSDEPKTEESEQKEPNAESEQAPAGEKAETNGAPK